MLSPETLTREDDLLYCVEVMVMSGVWEEIACSIHYHECIEFIRYNVPFTQPARIIDHLCNVHTTRMDGKWTEEELPHIAHT